jgi:hypothetical protein
VADPTRRQREDAGPSFATQAELAVTKSDVPTYAAAVTSGLPQPIATAAEETCADHSVRPRESADERFHNLGDAAAPVREHIAASGHTGLWAGTMR